MYRFIKVKDFNEHSLDDLANSTISFGLFSVFSNQKELIGMVDSKYLNEKYHDDSMTDDNVVNVLVEHINKGYLQFSFCKLSNCFPPKNILPKMYADYAKNKGFILYYEFDNVFDISRHFVKYYPSILDVKYLNDKFELTTFYDCFLSSVENEKFNHRKFSELLDATGHTHDLTSFMSSKIHYDKEYENEVRIIIQRNDSMNIVNDHISLPFVDPSFVCIPHSLSNKDKYKIIRIFNRKKLKYKIIGGI